MPGVTLASGSLAETVVAERLRFAMNRKPLTPAVRAFEDSGSDHSDQSTGCAEGGGGLRGVVGGLCFQSQKRGDAFIAVDSEPGMAAFSQRPTRSSAMCRIDSTHPCGQQHQDQYTTIYYITVSRGSSPNSVLDHT